MTQTCKFLFFYRQSLASILRHDVHHSNKTKLRVCWRTLGLCHLISFFGSGSSGIPMDTCSAGNVGSENSFPDLRHSSRSLLKSWSLNLIGFSVEPREGFLSVSIVSVHAPWNATRTSLGSCGLNSFLRTPFRASADQLGAPPQLPARKGMQSAGGRGEPESE